MTGYKMFYLFVRLFNHFSWIWKGFFHIAVIYSFMDSTRQELVRGEVEAYNAQHSHRLACRHLYLSHVMSK